MGSYLDADSHADPRKAEEAARNRALERVVKDLHKAETDWRRLLTDTPNEEIASLAAKRQEAREACRGLLSDDEERQKWDARCTQIDKIDAKTPASQRQAELAAAEQQRREAEARRLAELERQRQQRPSLSM